jgi:hypothetical protein
MAITHEDILGALKDRKRWEERQATWYLMRHEGLRRKNKPWPNAADMHFPLGDMLIEKLKPFYISQIFAGETVATFTGESRESLQHQTTSAQWFDYQLKQRTNFEREIVIGADRMLQAGKCPIKVYWDGEKSRETFEAINPIYLIVPTNTGALADADWVVHVQHISVAAYKRLSNFKTDDETMARLGTDETTGSTYETERYQREGITKPTGKEQIVLWEKYSRQDDGKIFVETYSPSAPTLKLRDDFVLPYNKGPFGEKNQALPFFELSCELKDSGYYDARGVIERVAPFETSLCKDWNTMKDYQTLTCAPVFYAAQGVPNGANVRMVPGQILPFQLQAVEMPPIPGDIAQSMMGTRQVAEQLVALPDFGTGSSQPGKDKKTATEVNLIGSVMGQNTDLRARIFRRELGYGLTLAYAILCQYAAEDRAYFYRDELMELPEQVLGQAYRIEPSGSGDNYNKAFVMQKAVARFQMFNNDPFFNQYNLRKSVVEADEPRLVKQLLQDAGTQSAEQQEDQAQEISIMLLGFPAQVRPTDDDMAHFQSLAGFVQRRAQLGEPMTPETLGLIAQHAQAHADALRKKNPDTWKQQGPQLIQFIRTVQQEAQQAAAQPAAPAPGNVVTMPPQMQAGAAMQPGMAQQFAMTGGPQ